jgi:GcrA cell cycle regulator
MGWTDERVETLKRLWLDGLSASQIAGQLGGVTRNAVIGKVHRLGLSGRAAPSQPARPTFKPARPPRPATGATPAGRRGAIMDTVAEVTPETMIETPLVTAPETPAPAPIPAAARDSATMAPLEETQAPVAELAKGAATVLTLGAHMCKWPIGDPSTADFTFCGRRASPERPYCVDHARLAYQPAPSKKKSAPSDLARSLRRYV